ncbi:MAG: amino acid adenylation domain-containing protein, partial [Cyanobacteria bacterium J06558_2]
FSQEATRLYKTGDLARYRADGEIEYLGRIDHQVKIRGFRIELGEIEAAIAQHPAVVETVVVARENIIANSPQIVAYLVAQTESTPEISDLREFLESKLPSYMIPAAFVVLEALPLTPNGKVDRHALPAPNVSISEADFIPAVTPTEVLLAGIWADILGLEQVGINHNFFELGGHSLIATRVISQIRQVFEVELPLRSLFEYPTIAGLAPEIERETNSASGISSSSIEKVSRREQLPLSYAQQRLWFLTQLEPDSSFYNIPAAVRLQGQLDLAALQQSFNHIITRHEALRTNFQTTKEGEAIAVISQVEFSTIPLIDLSDLAIEKKQTQIQQQIELEAQQPFDLSKKQLIRIKLLRLEAQEHVVLLTMHHIISDGWSIGILVRELATIYQAFSQGKPSPLAELPIQYVDFAAWQREWLQGKVLEKQTNYWLQQLKDAPQVLELPTDHPRPAVQTFTGVSYSFDLSSELSAALNQLSQQQGSTLFMTLLAGFQTLLWRYTAQSDIVIGSPIANRNRAEIEGLIGFFVNTLVLRTSLAGNPSFAELLQRVKETALGAYAHQDFPFELLVEQLQPKRDLSHTPLFQVMFVLQNAPMSELELPGLTLTSVESTSETAKFDLTLYMSETESGLSGSFEYSTDLFESATIERMTRHLEILLEAIVANPQQKLSDLPLLSESEQQLLVEWNKTKVEYPQDQNIHQLFEAQVEKNPDAIAIVCEDRQLTYRQLNQQANQLAHHLESLQVASGVMVGVCVEPSLEQVVSLLAVLKAGGAYVPLDPNYPPERLAFMLDDSQVPVLITRQSLSHKIDSQHAQIVCLDRDYDAIAQQSDASLNCQTTPDDLAYAIYTSGSTGRPKAVLGKLRGILNRLHWMWSMLPFAADEVCVQKTSINFVDHVAEIFSPLLKGIPLIIVPEEIRSDISQLINLLEKQKITRIVLVPSLLKGMLDSMPQHSSQLKHLSYVFCSGEALPLSLAEAFYQKLNSARLFNLYGSSEIAADVTCFEVNFWETRRRILQYFKPEVVHDVSATQFSEAGRKPFTQPGVSSEMLATKFQRSQLPSDPVTVDDYYAQFSQEVLPYTIDTASPTYIGHMTSALPDFMHDMSKMISRLNQNLVKIETSKSLIFLEREAIAMLHRLVYGYDPEFYEENIQQKNRNLGIITTGGTTANISALLCARNSGLLSQENSEELSQDSLYKILSQKGYEDIVILGSRLMHYSVKKAASMLGLGTDNIIFVDNNSDGQLNINQLREQICECRKNKLYILAIVGIAGTTETGEIDPLEAMGNIAQEFDIHFHVDGAWGGATIFSDQHRKKLEGIQQADSITICGHKQLYLPQGISVCLFKDPSLLNFAATTARYQAQRDTFDVGRFTIEGSRSAISLCLHGALHIIGKKGYEILINNGIEKAQYFARLIELLEPFELIMQPELNIVNYRYLPEDLRAKARQKSLSNDELQRINQLNTRVQQEQFERGLTFVSKTTLIDKAYEQEIVVFRTVLSNPNTTATDLQNVLEDQLRIAKQIETKSQEALRVKAASLDDAEAALVHQEAIHLRWKENSTADLAAYLQKNTISIGKPIANTQVYILDSYGSLLPPGIMGELYVGGDGLAQGYLNLPELTQEKFIPNPFITNNEDNNPVTSAKLYRTGDLARWLPDGNIEFIGRIDYQVKIRGFRIELGEIEAVIGQNPAVAAAVVLVREELTDFRSLVAYIVPEAEQTVASSELRQFLEAKLPNYMIPSVFITLEELPLNPNGKVDRKVLLSSKLVSIPSSEMVPASTPSEHLLARIWSEILGLEQVSVNHNFFELGGHSLIATRVASQIRQVFEVELPLRSLFEHPTIAGLASEIDQAIKSDSEIDVTPIEKVSRSEKIPLSYAQQRLWFLTQLEPDNPFYNISAAVRLQGHLNPDALQQSFNTIITRHEILRTTFQTTEEGEALAVISPVEFSTIPLIDLSDIPTGKKTTETQQQIEIEAQQPFDLSREELIRIKLLRLSAEEHIVLLTMHHIISDGWSIGVLVREIAVLYQALSQGKTSPLPQLPIQYVDFAAWQRQWLQGEVLERQQNYWLQQLENAPRVLELPTDRLRPAVQTFRGANHSFNLSPELFTALNQLSQQQGSTLFMTLLAGFQTLLWRYTAQEDIVVGSPIANRNRAEIEGLIGFFVNTLILRTNLEENPSFTELLQRVRETALGAYAHQDFPFELLVEKLQPERDLSRTPLFQVMFILQNAPMSALELPDLTLTSIGSDRATAKFDLTLSMSETESGLSGNFEYNTDLFEPETIERMAGHLETLLKAIVANPQQRLSDLPLLTEPERQQLLVEWNDTYLDYPQDKCIHQLFEEQVGKTPDAVALVFEDEQLTYQELNTRANQLAHYLKTLGVQPEVKVGIYVERSVEMFIGLLAILKAGGAYVPLDPSYPPERISFIFQDSQLKILLTQQHLIKNLPPHQIKFVCLDSDRENISQQSPQNLLNRCSRDSLAYIIYTSGSTGQPKGVVVGHGNVVRLFAATDSWYRFTQHDIWTQFHSIAFDFSVWEIWGALIYGGKLLVVPYWLSRSPEGFYQLLVTHQVTILNQTPSAFRQLMQVEESCQDNQSLNLRKVIFGGEALPIESLKPWFDRHGDQSPQLINMYGITETTVHVTYRPLTKADLELASESLIGRPIPDLEVYLLDHYGQPVPIGVPGEMYVGGAGVTRGYLNRPTLSSQRFIPNHFSNQSGARLYKSGDLARYLPNGDIEYLGRIDYQVKVRGFRIELGEMEAAIAQHPAVKETVVVAQEESTTDSTRLVSYIVAQEEMTLTISTLREFLTSRLPSYMIPNALVTLDTIPLTPNGKVNRKALPIPDQVRPELKAIYLPPQTEAEKTIANILQEALNLEKIGIHDNFFELGGHSLLLLKVHSKLQKIFPQLSIVDLFQYPTINYLAKYLTHKKEREQFTKDNVRLDIKSRQASINRRKQARKNHKKAKKKSDQS